MSTGNELYHHGILGQKWGVRRYQNPDGTLTEAGKKHYGKENTGSKKMLSSPTKYSVKRSNKFDYDLEDNVGTAESKALAKDIKEGSFNKEIADAIAKRYYEDYIDQYDRWAKMHPDKADDLGPRYTETDFKTAIMKNDFNSGDIDQFKGNTFATVYLYSDTIPVFGGHLFEIEILSRKDKNGRHINPDHISLAG